MPTDNKMPEKRRSSEEMEDMDDDFQQEPSRSSSPKGNETHVDQEKRMRREIANSNERRRMQSINAGFQSLKLLIPHQEGEKLSKAAILHHAAEHINNIEKEKDQLVLEVTRFQKKFRELTPQESGGSFSPHQKRKKCDTESSDEGISMHFDDGSDPHDCRQMYAREKQRRLHLEQRVRQLEEHIRSITSLPLPPPPPPPSTATFPSHTPKSPMASIHEEKMEVEAKVPEPAAVVDTPALLNTPAIPTVASLPLPLRGAPLTSAPQDIPFSAERHANATATATAITSPQSKRNLEIIAEAIRHLEGDNCGLFDRQESSNDFCSSSSLHARAESQTESSTSDQEDSKSESSGRGSPVPLAATHASSAREYVPSVHGLERQTATLHVSVPVVSGTAAVPLAVLHPHIYHHPQGFLIQKS